MGRPKIILGLPKTSIGIGIQNFPEGVAVSVAPSL